MARKTPLRRLGALLRSSSPEDAVRPDRLRASGETRTWSARDASHSGNGLPGGFRRPGSEAAGLTVRTALRPLSEAGPVHFRTEGRQQRSRMKAAPLPSSPKGADGARSRAPAFGARGEAADAPS